MDLLLIVLGSVNAGWAIYCGLRGEAKLAALNGAAAICCIAKAFYNVAVR